MLWFFEEFPSSPLVATWFVYDPQSRLPAYYWPYSSIPDGDDYM